MNLDSATIIAGVCGPDNIIGYETQNSDRKGQQAFVLGAKCDLDKDFFRETTKGHFCVVSSRTARGMSNSYLDHFPLSEHIFPFWGPSVLYTASKRLGRDVHDVIKIALKDCKKWNKDKHFLKGGEKRVFICGGAQIYKAALENAHVRDMYITFISEKFAYPITEEYAHLYTPIYFPKVNWDKWSEVGVTELSEGVMVKRFRR